MSKGFNVPIGSKRSLLEEFCVKVLTGSCHLLVNAWVKYEANLEPVDFRSVTAFWSVKELNSMGVGNGRLGRLKSPLLLCGAQAEDSEAFFLNKRHFSSHVACEMHV